MDEDKKKKTLVRKILDILKPAQQLIPAPNKGPNAPAEVEEDKEGKGATPPADIMGSASMRQRKIRLKRYA